MGEQNLIMFLLVMFCFCLYNFCTCHYVRDILEFGFLKNNCFSVY